MYAMMHHIRRYYLVSDRRENARLEDIASAKDCKPLHAHHYAHKAL